MKVMQCDHHITPCLLAIASIVCIVFPSTIAYGNTAIPESTDPVQVIENNWTSQKVLARITAQLLDRIGYNTELVSLDTQAQFSAMGRGVAHLQMEIWEFSMHESFMLEINAGRMVDGGSHIATTREDWWYPNYVEEICPGLPNYEAINNCAEKLATSDTEPNARYLAGPAEWHPEDIGRIEALGLKATIVRATSTDAIFDALKEAALAKEPILLFNWSPNWVGATFPGKFIEFPQRDAENKCVTEASWGVNPNKLYDCGSAVGNYLKKGLWSGFASKYPCASKLITNISFDTAMIETAAAIVETDGLNHDSAASLWIASHAQIVEGWMPDCAQQ